MIALVCALRCEAEKLIEYFHLKAFAQKSLFSIYHNGSLFLTISGVGKIQAAAATAYLHAITGEIPNSAWINFGIGGHPIKEIGEGCYAHQVVDCGNLRQFYPTLTWKDSVESETIYTVENVERAFRKPGIYDMEAAGFCASAFRISTAELIHCYKIVSDNKRVSPSTDPHLVRELIYGHLSHLEALVVRLQNLLRELDEWTSVSDHLRPFMEYWHFSETELYQLQRILQKLEAICPNAKVFDEKLKNCKKGREVLSCLNQKVMECFL
jgi:adenosylhomocysteine nucleosidase